MDIIAEAIERLEKKLRQRLSVLKDSDSIAILDDIDQVKKTQRIIANASLAQFIQVPVVNGNGDAPLLTQGDAAVEIIQSAGHPLHVSDILAEMMKRGIETKKQNLVSILLKDRRGRFVNKGGNTFDLRFAGTHSATSSNKGIQGLPPGFSLMDAIKRLLPELTGEFSQPVIFKMLVERYPKAADHIKKPSISTALGKLSNKGIIEVTHQGFGIDPRRYKRKGVS